MAGPLVVRPTVVVFFFYRLPNAYFLTTESVVTDENQFFSDSTSCAWNVTASDTETIQFKADHPFLIVVAIRDENPIIISIARLAVANDNF